MQIIGLTQGRRVPSTRFRWLQYLPTLEQAGFSVNGYDSLFGAYPPKKSLYRPVWMAASVFEGAVRATRSRSADLCFLQRNLVATLMTCEFLLKKPFVFDVDDAIFLGNRGKFSEKIAAMSSLVICGNNFLANHFNQFNDIVVLPTAVDTRRFSKVVINRSESNKVIGWSGSSSGFDYLYQIEQAISIILNKYDDVIFKVVSNAKPQFKNIPQHKYSFEFWSPEREVEVLNEFTVGIMPLEDSLWARGKCSFKMLTYMSVGIPVVVSPIGMNIDVLRQGEVGFSAQTIDDWVSSIESLLNSSKLCHSMGKVGRAVVMEKYSLDVVGNELAAIMGKLIAT